jgi:diacylglycerol kinase (ATP)
MASSRKLGTGTRRSLRAKLIFNATSGRPEESPQQLAHILAEMQVQQILPEVYMVNPTSEIDAVVHNAIKAGITLIVVAGGDGTVDSVVGSMVGTTAVLGIIPTGTRNNLAFNLGIPSGIGDAVALLRDGRRMKVDVGQANVGRTNLWFLEAASVGLLSDLYPVADGIQHGDLAQIGGLLSTLVTASPSHLRLSLDGRVPIDTTAHLVLVANMPFLGPRFQISPNVSFRDNRLDVFVFSDMSMLNLITYAMQSTGGGADDSRIKHYRVKDITIESDPPMALIADGMPLGQGNLTATIHRHALRVIAGAVLGGEPVALLVLDPGALAGG